MFRRVAAGTNSRLTSVDHRETYGRHVLASMAPKIDVTTCLDLGCGHGDDLSIVKQVHPNAKLYGVDFGDWNTEALVRAGISPLTVDIEREPLPFEAESLDLIIANQILEHTKEIYWINHEIFRTLRVGGCLYLGVPNVLAFHNRLLGLAGIHPTCVKMVSAHVRAFSKRDTYLFYNEVAGSLLNVEEFRGSQFYPFPRGGARLLSRLFPAAAGSIFFLIRKQVAYDGQFIGRLESVPMETNFYRGPAADKLQTTDAVSAATGGRSGARAALAERTT